MRKPKRPTRSLEPRDWSGSSTRSNTSFAESEAERDGKSWTIPRLSPSPRAKVTLALLRSLHFPVSITALDLSATSISAARKAVAESEGRTRDVTFAEGNLLSLPFADNSLDLVVTSGALEYVPLAEGMAELSRVIAPGGHLLHIPCRPSVATTFLEILFRFKKHPRKAVLNQTEHHFRMVHEYWFPVPQIIGWSKTAILAQKL